MNSSGIDSKKPALVPYSSNPESVFSAKTPDKIVKRHIFSSAPTPKIVVKLPERFEILGELFNALDTSMRLLKLKGSLTTYANSCPKIEFLTNRIFSYDHLAQMKHIYPEAIEVKRVLKYVEGSICLKPSLYISLSCGTRYIFHSKLVEFYKTHPKDEIPKELLPEPFNSSKRDSYSDTISVGLESPKLEEFDVHMEEMEQVPLVNKVIPDSALSSGTTDSTLPVGITESLLSHIESRIAGTPVKELSTPSKDLSTPIRLMSATPTLQQSRRCIKWTPDGSADNNSVRSTKGLARGPSRSLKFDTLEEDEIVKEDIGNKFDDEGIKYEAVDASEGIKYEAVDASEGDSRIQSLQMEEKPKNELEKHILPKLVDFIHRLFHSTKRKVITKEELLHKIIASQINIIDRREVEEQLSLMLQLVPDWISATKAFSGDIFVRINKLSAAETVRAKLEEATSQDISTVS